MRPTLSLCAALVACTGYAGEVPVRDEPLRDIVDVLPNPYVYLRAGGSATVGVGLSIAEGYHVQANPAADEFLIPLELHLDETEGLELHAPAYPAPGKFRLEGSDRDLLTYEGLVEVTVRLVATGSGGPGKRLVSGRVRYQACNARRCLPPASVPVDFLVIVSD